MGYHPRIESGEHSWFVTTRSQISRLWFPNNEPLEKSILSYAAKYNIRYEVKLYALAIEGNHIHGVMNFPNANRADFMRDFNSSVARVVPRHVPEFDGGRLWGRRYSTELLPGSEDIEEKFFYTVLQPVQDGQAEKLSKYPYYNCFHDAVHGISRTFKVINWGEYNKAKLRDPAVLVKDYVETVALRYERIPGYEHLSQSEYANMMLRKLEKRRVEIVKNRIAEGLGFVPLEKFKQIKPGAFPKRTKTSTRFSHRPRVLSVCPIRREKYKSWYFFQLSLYRDASIQYRAGNHSVSFPEGMYRPYLRPHPSP